MDYQGVIDLYWYLYEDRYRAKPTWSAEQGRQLKRLIKAHGADEVTTRLLHLFDGCLTWAVEPWTFGLFVRAFDSCVRPPTPPPRVAHPSHRPLEKPTPITDRATPEDAQRARRELGWDT